MDIDLFAYSTEWRTAEYGPFQPTMVGFSCTLVIGFIAYTADFSVDYNCDMQILIFHAIPAMPFGKIGSIIKRYPCTYVLGGIFFI
jgi:hypothetical protein